MREERLAQLERQLQQLTDRQAVLDCIARNARGCDRHDSDLLSSSYATKSLDDHGLAHMIPGKQYHAWANEVHKAGSIHNLHNITTHTCEIDGDTAHAESYVIGLFLSADGKTARLLSGRYVDKLVREDGEWRIALRRSTVEVGMTGDAAFLNTSYFREMGFLHGLRDSRDVSYQRPLAVDDVPEDHRWPTSD